MNMLESSVFHLAFSYNPSASSSYEAGSQTVQVSSSGGQPIQATFSQEICDVADFTYSANGALIEYFR
jgi:hypothetical protein